jgi:hypothetical protein
MYKPQKSEAEQQAFFNKSYEKFLQAKSVTDEINFLYRIADTTVCLKFAGNRLVPYLTPALQHLRLTDDCTPDFTICIWDSHSTGVEMVPPPCTKDCFTDRGDIWGFNSRRVKAAFHWIECSVNLIDTEKKTGIYWVQTSETLPYWVIASPLRTIFTGGWKTMVASFCTQRQWVLKMGLCLLQEKVASVNQRQLSPVWRRASSILLMIM